MAVDHLGSLPAGARDAKATSLLNNPTVRSYVVQVVLIVAVLVFAGWIINNTAQNLQRSHIASGYGFLEDRAGFEIGQSPISYTPDRTYGYALFVGFLNTLVVAGLGIVAATVVGFLVGIGRLSVNWLIRKLCTVYVEVFRNIPPLLVILFWYFGVIAVLPNPRDAIDTGIGISLSNRGAFMPRLLFHPGAGWIGISLPCGACAGDRDDHVGGPQTASDRPAPVGLLDQPRAPRRASANRLLSQPGCRSGWNFPRRPVSA